MTLADTLINAGLVAGGANLLNLFDLRPGRAIKVALLTGALLAPSRRRHAQPAPRRYRPRPRCCPKTSAERSMLGDAGANALGAMLGAAAAASLPRGARIGALAVVLGLTAASEKVSFTKVIERTGPLRALDMLGRRRRRSAGRGTDCWCRPLQGRPELARRQLGAGRGARRDAGPRAVSARPALGRGTVTGPAVPVTRDGQDAGAGPSALAGIGRAAALIAALTILARLLGLVRTIVFAKTVGATCLGTAYVTANALPNIIYDIVLGGALTSIMVPVLARPADRSAADPAAAAAGPPDVVGAC